MLDPKEECRREIKRRREELKHIPLRQKTVRKFKKGKIAFLKDLLQSL